MARAYIVFERAPGTSVRGSGVSGSEPGTFGREPGASGRGPGIFNVNVIANAAATVSG